MDIDRALSALGVVVGVAVLAAGCGSAPDEATDGLVGRWTRADPGVSGSVEFGPDGGFAMTVASGGTVEGTWSRGAEGLLAVTLTHSDILRGQIEPVEAETLVIEARVEGSMLHLTGGDETEVYRRASGDD